MSQRLGATALELAPTGGFPRLEEVEPPEEFDELTLLERLIALKQVAAFRGAPVDPLANLARLVEERRLEPKEVLFRIGEPAKNLFVVVNGRVDLIREDPVVRASFGPRTLVGGFSALGVADRIFSAEAVTRAQVLKIRIEDYFDLMEDHFEVGRTVLAEIARERTRLMTYVETPAGR
jgi:CRP-like cAMP-binding protein